MTENWFVTPETDYPALIRRTDAMEINTLFARSVLTGDADGVVYQNRRNAASAWYVTHVYGMTLLFGDHTDAAFQRALAAHFGSMRTDEWLQAYPAAWDPFLRGFVAKGLAKEYGRVDFSFDENKFRAGKTETRYEIARTPVSLIESYAGKVVPRSFWKKELYPRCVAYTVYADGAPASTAFAAYLHGNELELGIETQAVFRGKGFAELSCRALIDYCMENNYTPGWSCLDQNAGSMALAQKLGFIPIRHTPYYHIPAGNGG